MSRRGQSPSRAARTQLRAAQRREMETTVMSIPDALRQLSGRPVRPPCPIDPGCDVDHLKRKKRSDRG